jgi:hypothetical protein
MADDASSRSAIEVIIGQVLEMEAMLQQHSSSSNASAIASSAAAAAASSPSLLIRSAADIPPASSDTSRFAALLSRHFLHIFDQLTEGVRFDKQTDASALNQKKLISPLRSLIELGAPELKQFIPKVGIFPFFFLFCSNLCLCFFCLTLFVAVVFSPFSLLVTSSFFSFLHFFFISFQFVWFFKRAVLTAEVCGLCESFLRCLGVANIRPELVQQVVVIFMRALVDPAYSVSFFRFPFSALNILFHLCFLLCRLLSMPPFVSFISFWLKIRLHLHLHFKIFHFFSFRIS